MLGPRILISSFYFSLCLKFSMIERKKIGISYLLIYLFRYNQPGQRLLRWFSSKESACQCRRCWFEPWVGNIPWRRK